MKGNLAKGAKGKDVKDLQALLNKGGTEPKLKTDGIFGEKTQRAVQMFRDISRDVRPGKVADAAVIKALKAYIADARKREEMEIEIKAYKNADYLKRVAIYKPRYDGEIKRIEQIKKVSATLVKQVIAAEQQWSKLSSGEISALNKKKGDLEKRYKELEGLRKKLVGQKIVDDWPSQRSKINALENKAYELHVDDIVETSRAYGRAEYDLIQAIAKLAKALDVKT
ncbi:MAG: peptidoglycan-binding protein [Pseudomonadota bacterium]